MQDWALALVILAAVFAVAFVLIVALRVWARNAYKALLQTPATHCDIDAFVGLDRNPVSPLKVVLAHKLSVGSSRVARSEPIPLEVCESPHVEGLQVTRKRGTGKGKSVPLEQFLQEGSGKTPIVVATIRMGFGHHRLVRRYWWIHAEHVFIVKSTECIIESFLTLLPITFIIHYLSPLLSCRHIRLAVGL
jgi:hypothetical protein